tara:strand:- start:2655 stop:2942 length:288 start_codon:yes stop_codon:yes gene_type:complete
MPNRPPKKKKKTMSEETDNKPEITLNDFAAILRIVDVASRRGAFEGKELSSVGNVRDKVEAFLSFYAPKQDGEGEEAAPEEAPAEEPTIENTEGE